MSDWEDNDDAPTAGIAPSTGSKPSNYAAHADENEKGDDKENGWDSDRKSGGGGGYRNRGNNDNWGGVGRKNSRNFDENDNGGRNFGNSNYRRGNSRNDKDDRNDVGEGRNRGGWDKNKGSDRYNDKDGWNDDGEGRSRGGWDKNKGSNRNNDGDDENDGNEGRSRGGWNKNKGGSHSNDKDDWNDGGREGRNRGGRGGWDKNEEGDGFDGRRGRGGGRGRGQDDGGRRRHGDENGRGRDEGNEDGPNVDEKPREVYIPPEPTNDEEEIFHSGITSGINFSKYDNIPVDVSGDSPPSSIQSFDQAGLREILLENVQKSGYVTPTPIQKAAIPVIVAGRDLMACAQTGSGKTAAFLLPILNKLLTDNADMLISRPHALVVTPTRELAQQIFNEARKFALGSYLKIGLLYGGTSVKYQTELVAKGCHILIVTPGRLIDFVDRGKIFFSDIQFVVLDEADRMLDMGFSEAIGKIMQHETMPATGERQTLMFSATFPTEIQHLAGQYLNNYIFVTIGVVGGACTDVTQTIYETSKTEKRAKLMNLIQDNPSGTIVFVETKKNADFLASLLSETEYPTTSIHGDRLQRQREDALRDFKTGRMQILIATSVAARGLDIKNVQHVINYDLPKSIDEYVHRIGRTGRLGNKGRASSFFDPTFDSAIAPDLVRILKGADQEVPDFLQNLGGNSYGGGADDFGGDNRRDVRGGHTMRIEKNEEASGPAPLEQDEEWD